MRVVISVLFFIGVVWADQVMLTNGDRYTGSVLRSDTKTLVLETDNAGEVTLKRESIAAISAPGPIRKWLSWQLTISHRFLSNPVPGRKKNDTIFSAGLRVSFAK
jgi:hypothetical protein